MAGTVWLSASAAFRALITGRENQRGRINVGRLFEQQRCSHADCVNVHTRAFLVVIQLQLPGLRSGYQRRTLVLPEHMNRDVFHRVTRVVD